MREEVNNLVEPLNDLGEREVSQKEIKDICSRLRQSGAKLDQVSRHLKESTPAKTQLSRDLGHLLHREQEEQMGAVDDRLCSLDQQLSAFCSQKQRTQRKLQELKSLISEAKGCAELIE